MDVDKRLVIVLCDVRHAVVSVAIKLEYMVSMSTNKPIFGLTWV